MASLCRFALVLAVCLLPPRLSIEGARQRPDGAALLDRYAAGDYDVVRAAAIAAPAALVEALERGAPAWIAAGEDPAARRLIAAAFALEAAAALVDTPRRILYRQLVEWGCGQVRRVPAPDPRVTAWHLAAVSLMLRARDWPMLAGPEPGAIRPAGEAGEGHLRHARDAIPDEARLRLAEAVVDENRASSVRAVAGDETGNARLIELAARYRDLTEAPAIAADAWLRLGMVSLRLGESTAAMAAFAQAEALAPDDPHTRHLARFLLAIAHDAAGRPAAALEELRTALRLVPRATSATVKAAALLIADDARNEAADLIEALLAASPVPDDPWRLYPAGDGRRLDADLARLREILRP